MAKAVTPMSTSIMARSAWAHTWCAGHQDLCSDFSRLLRLRHCLLYACLFGSEQVPGLLQRVSLQLSLSTLPADVNPRCLPARPILPLINSVKIPSLVTWHCVIQFLLQINRGGIIAATSCISRGH